MNAINTKTGALITGTFERLTGKCPIRFDGQTDEKGLPNWEHLGGTEVFLEEAHTQSTETGLVIFLDEEGDEVPHDQIELVTAYEDPNTKEVFCSACDKRDPTHRQTARRGIGQSKARGRKCSSCSRDAGTSVAEAPLLNTPTDTVHG